VHDSVKDTLTAEAYYENGPGIYLKIVNVLGQCV